MAQVLGELQHEYCRDTTICQARNLQTKNRTASDAERSTQSRDLRVAVSPY